jgi:ABC-type transport system substrate-binding protein
VAFTAAALLMAACGGDDDDAGGDTTTGGSDVATTAAPGDTAGATTPAGSAPADSSPADTAPAGEPTPGGTLRYATAAEPTTFDPHKGASGGDHVSLYPIFDRLLNSDPVTLEPVPFLAKTFDFTDPTTLDMTLEEGVMFTDGTPFNAEAVVYNIDRARTMEDSTIKTDLSSIDSVEAVGEYEVVLHLNQPDSSLLGVFADRAGMMVSPTAAENADFGEHPVGTGPHTFESWAKGDTWTYGRNEDYWQAGLPYLDNLSITVQSDGNTKINGLRSGQYDFIDGVEPGRIAELEGVDNLVVSSDPTLLQHMVWWNIDRGPLADVRVRRAINMAIDRQSMWEATMEGTGEVAWLPVPSQHWAFSPDLVPSFEYDPEGAKALLEEAGYGDGFAISMTSGAGQDFVRRAEIMQAQLAEIGISVEITPEQTVDSVQSYFTDKRMDSFNTSMTSRPDPSITFQTVFSAESFYNTAAMAPEGFDELLLAAKAAQTLDERKEAFHALNAAVVENALWVPLVYPASTTAHVDEFAGFVPSLIGKPDFLGMYQVD